MFWTIVSLSFLHKLENFYMEDLIASANELMGTILICLLLGTGVYFTVRLGFLQFRHFGHMFSIFKQ